MMKSNIAIAAAAMLLTINTPAMAGEKGAHAWGYTGSHGPEHWGDINATCTGAQQSPIDITTTAATDAEIDKIDFNYKSSTLSIVNNGHTIQANIAPGSSIKVADKTYELLQFHFHSPSEHTTDGQSHDMEVHLVHKAADGALAVVGVMLDKAKANDTLAPIWNNMPSKPGTNDIKGATIAAADLLPKKTDDFYHYMGSLTTPPCTEVVSWFVMKDGITVSDKQVAKFVDTVGTNARPVQPLNRRFVLINE
jgi:carbonic anhydrase